MHENAETGTEILDSKCLVVKEKDGEDVLRVRLVTGCCECGNELSNFIKCRQFVG